MTTTETLHHAYTSPEQLDEVKKAAEERAAHEDDGRRTMIHLGEHVDDKCTTDCTVWPAKKR